MSGLSNEDREALIEFVPTAPIFVGDYDDLFTVVEQIANARVAAALNEAADAIESLNVPGGDFCRRGTYAIGQRAAARKAANIVRARATIPDSATPSAPTD